MKPALSVPEHNTANRRGPRRLAGFTLIEIMVTLAILAITMAIAVPTYFDQVRKSRRADAVSSMMSAATYLERCFTQFNVYNDDECASPAGDSADDYYDLTIVRAATTFTVTATPKGDQAKDRCGAMTLDYLGNKTPVPGNNRCWGSS